MTARRDREAVANVEKTSRRRRLSPDSPELEKIWLFLGVGRSSAGVEQIVRRYPDAVLPDEINRAAKAEVCARRAWDCLRCREPLTPNRVELPEPFYLEIVDKGKPILEGWAYEGEFRQEFPECPKCGAKQPY
ncbi:MAG: hypothetical protein ABIK44_03340 [candidate division WOR-3 bacterium]